MYSIYHLAGDARRRPLLQPVAQGQPLARDLAVCVCTYADTCLSLSLSIDVYIYIYIYIHMHIILTIYP